MVYSISDYLDQQSTKLLKQLLCKYEAMAEDDYYAFLASLIHTILFLRGAHDDQC